MKSLITGEGGPRPESLPHDGRCSIDTGGGEDTLDGVDGSDVQVIPGQRVGTYDAADINYATRFLAGLVEKHDLPPKILVVHRFTRGGVTNADKIVAHIEKIEHTGTGAIATFDKRHDLVWAVGKTSGIAVQWQDGKKVPFWPPQVKGMQPFKMPAR